MKRDLKSIALKAIDLLSIALKAIDLLLIDLKAIDLLSIALNRKQSLLKQLLSKQLNRFETI
jgi:hypothetical protein